MSPSTFRRITLAVLLTQAVIVLTGAAVRLTGSGLGCTNWPNCTEERLVAPTEYHAVAAADGPVLEIERFNLWYGAKQALHDVTLSAPRGKVTALIGPSGCGKSTFLRCFNRMNDTIAGCRVEGRITLDGEDIYDRSLDVVELRARVGMVFQKPNPFPKSIFDNVAYGPRIHGLFRTKEELEEIVAASLRRAGLWSEVKDRLREPGTGLSGGQQQRLCIARAIAVQPQVLLMDEPCSALDPIATARIEDLMRSLRDEYTIVIVTHNMQQAARVSDTTGFFNIAGTGKPGNLIEMDDTEKMFSAPSNEATEAYISGRFG